MTLRILISVAAILITSPLASADKASLAKNIQCDKFTRVQNGWRSAKDATLGDRPFKNNTFGPGKVIIDGVDVATLLDEKCGRPQQ
jgi:hypothetical protein